MTRPTPHFFPCGQCVSVNVNVRVYVRTRVCTQGHLGPCMSVCVHYSMLCVGMRVFICFDTDLPLWPSGLKREPTVQSLRQYTAITGARSPKEPPLTTSVWPSKHKHSWFKHWYRHIKRWMNYILHLPFRHVAGNLIQSDICFEFLLVITRRRKVIVFSYFLL